MVKKYRNKWRNFSRSAAKKNIPKFITADYCWYNRESEGWCQLWAVRYSPSYIETVNVHLGAGPSGRAV